ncbi:sensor histidine kinase [Indioceanicola profundi]|uniref:sensor histidine kinase n=1 Tax=Indioceanicola profundi TaxID=2220096 RepID=UPI0013C4B5BD|nr:PAS domain-containing sensor histidine kinase [Indioceanicola profundi]
MDHGPHVPDSALQDGGGDPGHAASVPPDDAGPRRANERRRQERRVADRDAAVLRRAFEGFSDGILVCDGEDRAIFSNPRLHSFFPGSPGVEAIQGWSFERIMREALLLKLVTGTGTDEPVDPERHVAQRMAQRRALTGRTVDEVGIAGRWYRRVEERIPESSDGSLPGGAIVTTYSDITDLKQARMEREAAKLEAERGAARLAAAVEAIPGGFVMMDENLNYLVWNSRYPVIGGTTDAVIRSHRTMEETLRFQAERGDWDHIRIDPARFSPAQIAATPILEKLIQLQSARAPGELPSAEERETMVAWHLMRFAPGGRPDGETGESAGTFRVADTGAVVEYRRNRVPGVGWVSLYTEITERVRQVEEAAAARAAAEAALAELRAAQDSLIQAEKLASLGGLVAGIAHELNTPVGISYTAANHLRTELSKFRTLVDENRLRKADLDEFLELVGEAANLLEVNSGRASRLVQSFKNVSADQASDQRRTFELRPYLDEIVMSVGPRWKRGGHLVHLHCPDGIVMDSYPGALGQVLTNLIVNSTVHGFEDGRSGRIDISVVRPLGGEIVLVYRDDGRGIPLADLPRIFDPFFTTRRGQGSTGLGLNIVYNLVTRTLQGRIDVWSAPGQGTRFTLRLPQVVKAEE